MSDAIQAPTCPGTLASGDSGFSAGPCAAAPGELADGAGFSAPERLGTLANGLAFSASSEAESGQTLTGGGAFAVSASLGEVTEGGALASACAAQPQLGGDSPVMSGCIPCAPGPNGSLGKYVAGEAISGGRFVLFGRDWKIYKASGPLSLPAQAFIKQAVSEGAQVEVWQSGRLHGLSGIQPGQYWLGANGVPTQSVPSGGICQPIGQGLSATEMIVDIEEPIFIE